MSLMGLLDPLLALLLLLPAAWLAIPTTLAGQLEPELTATGWWVLLQLAPACVLAARKPRPAGALVTLYGGFVALSLGVNTMWPPSDTLSASRAVLIAIASWSALGAGCALESAGRRVLAVGFVAVSIGLSVPAILGASARFQGALQNSGATSEAALLGALAALAWWSAARGPARAFGLFAIAAYGVFVALAPVIAGALIFICVAGVFWFLRSENRRAIALGVGAFAFALIATLAVARASSPTRDAKSADGAAAQGHLGGVEVRLRIAPRALAMFVDHPWFGVGPGQFRAAFPIYRDQEERANSNRAAGPGIETEVEHAHDDLLTTLDEVGIFGALLWTAILAWLVRSALRALQAAELPRVALALAVLGGALNLLLRAPLTFNPASASLFFAAAGGLIAQDGATSSRRLARRSVALLGLALLALQAPRAWSFVAHGRALRLPGKLDLPAALAACPDSPLALSLQARELASDPARVADARAAWDGVIALRPLNFEARMQAGVLAADANDVVAARHHWQRALEIAPERTGVLQNLLLMEARTGLDESFQQMAARAEGVVPRAWAIGTGTQALLEGDEHTALRLWKFAAVDWIDEPAQRLYDRSREHEEEPSKLKTAWELLAHLRWAREFAAVNDFTASVRSYRQAVRVAPEASSAHLELAAALWCAGKQDEARAEIERAKAKPADWTRLAPWAGDVLLKAGLFAGQ